ncbi:MAG TPA: hypothetical protein GX503_00205, partial [Clostridiales bacterium]|nr:hypothetical protein [Clostridiales bacterium]
KKGILKIFFYGILVVLSLSFVFYWADEKNLFHVGPKKKIFSYLKEVQPLEEKFYKLVEENQKIEEQRTFLTEQEYLQFLEESILALDEIIVNLAAIDPREYMQENKFLFLEEMKAVRNMLAEKRIGIKTKDESSLFRAETYLENYHVMAQARRDSLKNSFNKHGIVHIDLKDRIRYKIR